MAHGLRMDRDQTTRIKTVSFKNPKPALCMKLHLNASLLFLLCVLSAVPVRAQSKITGSGRVVRKEISIAGFHKLRNLSSANLYLTDVGTTPVAIIEADDNIVPLIEITSQDGVLTVKDRNKAWFNTKNNINVYVPVETLSELENNGSGNITAEKTIETPALVFGNNGSGNVTFPLKTKELQLEQNGSGNVSLSGQTQSFTLTSRGSGNLNAAGFATETAQVKLSGSGNASIQCANALTVQLTGSGNVTYTGNPNLVKNVSGSGEVQRKGG